MTGHVVLWFRPVIPLEQAGPCGLLPIHFKDHQKLVNVVIWSLTFIELELGNCGSCWGRRRGGR